MDVGIVPGSPDDQRRVRAVAGAAHADHRVAFLYQAGLHGQDHHLYRDLGALAEEFQRAPFPTYSEHEYADLLIDFLGRLPPTIAIIRINTDTRPDKLIAPRWKMRKEQFANYIAAEMKRRGRYQGDSMV